jgi:hypothetical protein
MDNISGGIFGKWIEGIKGVPAYKYELDQTQDPRALTMTNEAWNDRRNHIFQIGNDRITATCSNFGYIQVRQDERCPKYLNDYNPSKNQYGGGFGYLKTPSNLLSTFYRGGEMHREYGAGYFKKITDSAEAKVEEIIFAPYGDDPVLLKKVKITNLSNFPLNCEWYDYFGSFLYQFTFTHYCAAQLTFNTKNVSKMRRRLEFDFHKTVLIDKSGVEIKRKYSPNLSFSRFGQFAAESVFATLGKRFYSKKNYRGFDDNPPSVLYCCLNETAEVLTDSKSFFGKGGAENPQYFSSSCALKNGKDMQLLKTIKVVPANESVEFFFLFAYEPLGFSINEIRNKYLSINFQAELERTLHLWETERVSVKIENYENIDKELMWHNTYLRGAMSYSDYFGSHILSQGGHYQYLMGLQGAPRDQLQHSLSFIYTDPKIAREHILFSLREMSTKGELPYATHGYGMMVAAVMVPSDLQLMLLGFIGEYLLATRDYSFLDYSYTSKLSGENSTLTVYEGLMLAYKYVRDEVGRGEHGLVKMKTGDWNDQAVYGRVPLSKVKHAQKYGESMLNSGIAAYAYKVFGEALIAYGKNIEGLESLSLSQEITQAIKEQWNGKWFKRAFLGDKIGWLGDELLWLEPQPWALIAEATNGTQASILAENISSLLSNPNGASLISKGEKSEDSKGLDEGTLENGGIWPAVNGYLVWGLSKVDGNLAFQEWLKNSRFAQSKTYPDIWYGIWSGPDAINASYAKYPGRTQNSKNPYTGKREKFFKLTVGVDWEDFPVLNLHTHTWQQYTIFKLLGAEFSRNSLFLKPVIPAENYEIKSRLLSVKREKNIYDISYNPYFVKGVSLVFSSEKPPITVFRDDSPIIFTWENNQISIPLLTSGENIRIEF